MENRRTPRYPLVVDVEMTDVQSGGQIKARTTTLSAAGCGVQTPELFPQGTSINIRLFHQGKIIRANARIVYSSPSLGMGMAFTGVEREDEPVLQWLIAEHLIPVPE